MDTVCKLIINVIKWYTDYFKTGEEREQECTDLKPSTQNAQRNDKHFLIGKCAQFNMKKISGANS